MRSVSYENATDAGKKVKDAGTKVKGLVTEKTNNLYGSTAGAGSGEFHTYRHARARENQRMEMLDEEEAERLKLEEYEARVATNAKIEDAKTAKRRKKREKQKMNKKKREAGKIFDEVADEKNDSGDDTFGPTKEPSPVVGSTIPLDASLPRTKKQKVIKNDGNFLEMMLAQQALEKNTK